jgi:hypothetical protein
MKLYDLIEYYNSAINSGNSDSSYDGFNEQEKQRINLIYYLLAELLVFELIHNKKDTMKKQTKKNSKYFSREKSNFYTYFFPLEN